MNGRGPRRPDGFIQKSNARYDRHDALYRKAKKEGFAARSVYKLEEIDRETKLLRARDRVLAEGAATGAAALKGNPEWAMCCTDGPVFEARDLDWDRVE